MNSILQSDSCVFFICLLDSIHWSRHNFSEVTFSWIAPKFNFPKLIPIWTSWAWTIFWLTKKDTLLFFSHRLFYIFTFKICFYPASTTAYFQRWVAFLCEWFTAFCQKIFRVTQKSRPFRYSCQSEFNFQKSPLDAYCVLG